MRRHPTAPANVARISVATSGTDFTAPEANFAALIRAAGCCPGRSHFSRGSCRYWDCAWSAPGARRTFIRRQRAARGTRVETQVMKRRCDDDSRRKVAPVNIARVTVVTC